MKSAFLFAAVALCCTVCSSTAWSKSDITATVFKPSPKADQRGYIDVWQLRRDVAALEAMQRKQNVYAGLHQAFNRAWLPLLHTAIRQGDPVAEVILRQCETTPVLDRSGIESSCDEDPQRRVSAIKRLKAIGFLPALDISDELDQAEANATDKTRQRELNQLAVLNQVRAGDLSFDSISAGSRRNAVKDPSEQEVSQRWALLEAVRQDAPRAFRFSPGSDSAGWATASFAALRLNRKALTPGSLTWGPALDRWQAKPVMRAGMDGLESEPLRKKLLAEVEASIDAYLARDPRWAVFLIERVGHHEWRPHETRSQSHRLDAAWSGEWQLEKATADWNMPLRPSAGRALIERSGEGMQITVTAEHDAEPLRNVSTCGLRYSGGSTYLQKPAATRQTATGSLLGSFQAGSTNREALAPFDTARRFKQVLMQCDGAEAPGSTRVRFLLLAGDVLVEFGASAPDAERPAVRHYRRIKSEK